MTFLQTKNLAYRFVWFFFLIYNLNFKNIKNLNNNFLLKQNYQITTASALSPIVKKNLIPIFTNFTPYRFKMQLNKHLVFNFKYLNLFNFVSKFKKKKKKKNDFKVFYRKHLFYFKNTFKFFNTKYPLTGKLISYYRWDLTAKKKWNRFEPLTVLKLNRVISKTTLPNDTFNDVFIKKLYFNNYFYFSKLKTTYGDLKYLCKLAIFKKKPNSINWQTLKPYLFLNSANRKINETAAIELFRFYQKTFYFLIKLTPRQPLFKNSTDIVFKNYNSFQKKIKKISKNFKVSFTLSNERVFRKTFLKKRLKSTRRLRTLLERKWKFLRENKFKNKNLRYFYKNNFYKTFFSLKNLKKLNNFFKIKNYKNLAYKIKLKKFCYLLILRNLRVRNPRSYFNKFKKYKIKKNLNVFFFLKNFYRVRYDKNFLFSKNFNTSNFKNLTNVKLLNITSNYLTSFILNKYAFIYISNNIHFYIRKPTYVADYKKNNFSFLLGNDLHRFIIKRYLKSQTLNFFYENGAQTQIFATYNDLTTTLTDRICNSENIHSALLFKKHKTSLLSIFTYNSLARRPHTDNNLNYWETISGFSTNFNIKRVKFKPGYMTIWRNARSILKKILNLKLRYQYRLTRYVTKLIKFVRFKILLFHEMQLNNIIIKSRLVPDRFYGVFFIERGLIYVNGLNCYNPTFVTYVGDFIQAVINVKYYVIYRWLTSWSLKRKIKLKIKTRKKNSPARFNDEKIKSYLLPDWVLLNKNITEDVSKFLEVDYLTLSVSILYEPFNLNEFNVYNLIAAKYSILNLYNWKYIT